MNIPNRKKKIREELKILSEKMHVLRLELGELYKKDHRQPQCEHGIDSVCYYCSYP